MKKKIYDILVIGTGLSSLTFIDAFLENNNSINIISFNKSKKKFTQIDNNHILKILPPQMIGEDKQVMDYFSLNKIIIDKNTKFFGSLEFGGLSNYWGLQIDKNIEGDISHFSKKTQKKIKESFYEILNKLKLLGKVDNKYKNIFIKDKYIDKKFFEKSKELISDEPLLAFQKKGNKKGINLNLINEEKDKLTPLNLFNKNLKNKKIIFHNFFVEKIQNCKEGLKLYCSNGEKKEIFITKKLVLGCGTLITTKLIMDYLNIKREVKIFHHPRLFSVYFSKKKWKNKMKFQPSHFHLKWKKNPLLFTADFRPGNKIIIEAIVKFKKFLNLIKFFLNAIREHFIFSNIFFNPKFSNLYLKKRGDVYLIFSKNKNIKNLLKKTSKKIFNFLISSKKILPFYINYFPGFGADFHYFGTIQVGKSKDLSVNEKCQINKKKNIYIVDGSVFKFNGNKYPLGLIMANARRIGKEM
jgi:hypothetical protein